MSLTETIKDRWEHRRDVDPGTLEQRENRASRGGALSALGRLLSGIGDQMTRTAREQAEAAAAAAHDIGYGRGREDAAEAARIRASMAAHPAGHDQAAETDGSAGGG